MLSLLMERGIRKLKNRYMEEAIKGLNEEKLILTEALTRISDNQSIKVCSRLYDIDKQILEIINPNKE